MNADNKKLEEGQNLVPSVLKNMDEIVPFPPQGFTEPV